MEKWSRECGMKSGERRSWLPYPKAVLIWQLSEARSEGQLIPLMNASGLTNLHTPGCAAFPPLFPQHFSFR